MTGKKVLILEDDEAMANMLARLLTKKSLEPIVLAKQNDDDYVVNNVEEIVKREQPDIAIIDGLFGNWETAAEKILRIRGDTKIIIYSGSGNIREAAALKGYNIFIKPQEQSKVFDFLMQA